MTSLLASFGLSPLVHGLLLLGAGIVLAVVSRLLLGLGERNLRRTTFVPERLSVTKKLFPATSMVLWLTLARSWWSVAAPKHSPPLVGTLLNVALVVAVGYWAGRVLYVGIRVLESRYDLGHNESLRARRIRTQLRFIEKLLYAAIGFGVVCGSLLMFEAVRQVGTSLIASAGIASVIIGFAAQKSLANLIAGIQIAFTQPVRLDDEVVVEGESGTIEEINLTYVVVRLWDQRRLVLPITYLVEKPFQNWTRTPALITGTVMLDVSHAVPFSAVERELQRLLEASPLWDRGHWALHMVEATGGTVRLRALMTAAKSGSSFDLRCYVRRGLVEFLHDHHPEALPGGLRVDLDDHRDPDRVATGFDPSKLARRALK